MPVCSFSNSERFKEREIKNEHYLSNALNCKLVPRQMYHSFVVQVADKIGLDRCFMELDRFFWNLKDVEKPFPILS